MQSFATKSNKQAKIIQPVVFCAEKNKPQRNVKTQFLSQKNKEMTYTDFSYKRTRFLTMSNE